MAGFVCCLSELHRAFLSRVLAGLILVHVAVALSPAQKLLLGTALKFHLEPANERLADVLKSGRAPYRSQV